jgi:hypothetical protein
MLDKSPWAAEIKGIPYQGVLAQLVLRLFDHLPSGQFDRITEVVVMSVMLVMKPVLDPHFRWTLILVSLATVDIGSLTLAVVDSDETVA